MKKLQQFCQTKSSKLGNLIKNQMEFQSITENYLSVNTGVSIKKIQEIKKGKNCNVWELFKILDFLGLEMIPTPLKESNKQRQIEIEWKS